MQYSLGFPRIFDKNGKLIGVLNISGMILAEDSSVRTIDMHSHDSS